MNRKMATASNNRDEHNTYDADFREDFNQGMLCMLSEGSSNDVRIILSDGEIMANRDVLAAQCEYFAANFRFKKETQDDRDYIEIKDCSKEVMERILKYLFTGSIKFKDLSLLQLLELLNQVKKMLLKDVLQNLINKYIIYDTILFNCSKFIDLVQGVKYAYSFVLDSVKPSILSDMFHTLPNICKDNEAISAFSTLPFNIVEEMFTQFSKQKISFGRDSCGRDLSKSTETSLYIAAKLYCLLAWYNQNKDMCQEDKKKMLGMIDLDLPPAADLFQLVKRYWHWLFPNDKEDKRIVECLRERDEMKKNLAA